MVLPYFKLRTVTLASTTLLGVPYGPELAMPLSVSANMVALAGPGVPPAQLPGADQESLAPPPVQVLVAANNRVAISKPTKTITVLNKIKDVLIATLMGVLVW